jgi:hypothetical protein
LGGFVCTLLEGKLDKYGFLATLSSHRANERADLVNEVISLNSTCLEVFMLLLIIFSQAVLSVFKWNKTLCVMSKNGYLV